MYTFSLVRHLRVERVHTVIYLLLEQKKCLPGAGNIEVQRTNGNEIREVSTSQEIGVRESDGFDGEEGGDFNERNVDKFILDDDCRLPCALFSARRRIGQHNIRALTCVVRFPTRKLVDNLI